MRFKSQQHKSTFKKAIRKKDKTDNKLMAAMYLLVSARLFCRPEVNVYCQ